MEKGRAWDASLSVGSRKYIIPLGKMGALGRQMWDPFFYFGLSQSPECPCHILFPASTFPLTTLMPRPRGLPTTLEGGKPGVGLLVTTLSPSHGLMMCRLRASPTLLGFFPAHKCSFYLPPHPSHLINEIH
jgi:hypothetical protein